MGSSPVWHALQQSGAAEACWARNPEVDGSKPSFAKRNLMALVPDLQLIYYSDMVYFL